MNGSRQPDSLDAILADYLERLDEGKPIDREVLLASHPALASDLAEFFEDCDAVCRAVGGTTDGELAGPGGSPVEASRMPADDGKPSLDRRPRGGSRDELNHATTNELLEWLQRFDTLSADREFQVDDRGSENRNGEAPTPTPTQCKIPPRIGRFRIQRVLGRGGFGVVFLADDPSLGRLVALKIPRPEIMFSKDARQRFLREAQLVALLDHRGVVPVYETGEVAPLWYIASAYCSGPTLAEWLATRQDPVPPRLAAHIVSILCDAVHHAHSRGVLHRDLKPSNILLEPVDEPQLPQFPYYPKVADFGLAIRREEPHNLTRSGMLLGTSRYMAPEQAAGDAKAIGVATDVHAIGVILYELLSGSPPFIGRSDAETLRAIQQDHPAEAPLRARGVPRDLQAVCLKCLAKGPQLRYQSAADLAAELQRYLDGRPVIARSVGHLARAVRWCGRHPTVAALMAILIVVTTIGALGVLWQWRRAERNYADTRSLLYAANLKLAEAAWGEGNIRSVNQLLEPFDNPAGHPDLRGSEWYFLRRLCHQEMLTVEGTGRVSSMSLNADNTSILVGMLSSGVRSFDTRTGERRFSLPLTEPVIAVAFSADETRLATLEKSGAAKVWTHTPSRRLVSQIDLGVAVWTGAFTSSLSRIAAGGEDYKVRLWDLTRRSEYRVLSGHTARIRTVSFSKGETQLISGSEDGTVRIWDLQTGVSTLLFEHPERHWIMSAAVSHDGALLAAGCGDNSIIVWEIASRRQVLTLSGHAGAVDSLAFSPDDKSLVSGSADKTICVWHMPNGELARTIRGHIDRVTRVMFKHASGVIISGSDDETIKLWDLRTDDFRSPRPRKVHVKNALFSDDGRRIACRFEDGSIIVFELPAWRELIRLNGPSAESAMAYDSRRNRIAVSHADGKIELWQNNNHFRQFDGHTAEIKCLALSSNGRWLASGSSDETLRVWDIQDGTLKFNSGKQPRQVFGAAFSPDSKLLLSVSYGDIAFWDPATGKLLRTVKGHGGRIYHVSFNHTGELIATGERSGTISIWDSRTGDRVTTLGGHRDRVYAHCFTPDHRRLVSCGRDGTIRWWDLATSRELYAIQGDWGPLEWLTVSADGWTLLAINEAGELRLWDSRP